MRIVAGKHRGRALIAPAAGGIRPTADRVREAVFNILSHGVSPSHGVRGIDPETGFSWPETSVLDAFCGTGALGLEALSRGAATCRFLDVNPAALALVRENLANLGEAARAGVMRADVLHPPASRQPATLAFLDPPYGQSLIEPALSALAHQGWLGAGTLVVVECDARESFVVPAGFEALDARRYGHSRVEFLVCRAPA